MDQMFNRFSVLFSKDEVYLDNKHLPIGQCAADVMNLEDDTLARLWETGKECYPAVNRWLHEQTDSVAIEVQKTINTFLDLVYTLPGFRDVNMDRDLAYNFFRLPFTDKDRWTELQEELSITPNNIYDSAFEASTFVNKIYSFQMEMAMFVGMYLDPLKNRSTESYAKAYAKFFNWMKHADGKRSEARFEQDFSMTSSFVPMEDAEEPGRFILAERAMFDNYGEFLYIDFYRGLIAGNAPRKCQNCGKYFLLTSGYNTCYCNNVAPGETERTCRKVGAHKKEAQAKAGASPAQKEYAKTYNRLKARKQRGKISADEWNASVAIAQALKDDAEKGNLSDIELKEALARL